MFTFSCTTAADTFALGERFGQLAQPFFTLALIGDIGMGKTVFSRGLGLGLAVRSRVSSPTFVLVQEHIGGRLPFRHADLYRISEPAEAEDLGLDEAFPGVTIVEWAERWLEGLPEHRLLLNFEDVGGSTGFGDSPRRIAAMAYGETHGAWLDEVAHEYRNS